MLENDDWSNKIMNMILFMIYNESGMRHLQARLQMAIEVTSTEHVRTNSWQRCQNHVDIHDKM